MAQGLFGEAACGDKYTVSEAVTDTTLDAMEQANDGQEVSDGSDEESDLEKYKEKEVVEEDGGLGGGDGQAGESSLDTEDLRTPRFSVSRGMLWRHVRPPVS